MNWKHFTFIILALLVLPAQSYLQFELVRVPHISKAYNSVKTGCPDETKINQQAEYKELCYQKDISYSIKFLHNDQIKYFSVDLTTPISWVKDKQCKIAGINKKCTLVENHSIRDKVEQVKDKINEKIGRKKKDSDDDQIEDAIIEGSNEIIRGALQKSKDFYFETRDSSRLTNLFDLLMLGLYIFQEKDQLCLKETYFINAILVSQNVNNLNDGALSLRFDENSENSFLNQIFAYLKATEKIVTIYLGKNNSLTIGEMTAKYSQSGFSGIVWIEMPENDFYGKMAQTTGLAIEHKSGSNDELDIEIPAVFTLSASYIGLPEKVINDLIIKKLQKIAKCSVNKQSNFVECTASNKKTFQALLTNNLIFSFGDVSMMVPFDQLILKKDSKNRKIVFSLKQTSNNYIILGEPLFLRYYMLFDYSKTKIGFAPRRDKFPETFINLISLVHFLVVVFVSGCCFILCFNPCKRIAEIIKNRSLISVVRGSQGKRLRQYSPIQQNPYQDLKGKIQEVIRSSQDEVQGI